jgi:SAM-dependent methyltransferase
VIPAIHQIQRRYINSQHDEDLTISEEDKNQIRSAYGRLKAYIKTFLGTDLARNHDGQPMLFGRRIGETQLSDGQKILLQFCLAIYAQEMALEDLIIFMDEPENHLHPGALVYVLDTILEHIPNGQLWISTHSINVLAHFDPSCIWYIDQGKISYAGNIPRTVLETLVGSENEIEKLSSFLSLPAQMASTKFAYESLFYPKVLITGPNDPQINQINTIINDFKNENQKLKVLDFGTGKGRLISTISENARVSGNDVGLWLDMYGYDNDITNKEICIKAFESVYGTAETKYYNEATKILTDQDANTFDLIIMTNVLHEIDPKDWIQEFSSPHSVFSLLKDDGYLLIVEDQFLAIGEKAHSKGFLVLDAFELKTLFCITNADNFKSNDYRSDGRLKAHYIPKACITRITPQSRREALESLLTSAKENIKRLRALENSFKNGKLHGFWSQQLANAALALEEL